MVFLITNQFDSLRKPFLSAFLFQNFISLERILSKIKIFPQYISSQKSFFCVKVYLYFKTWREALNMTFPTKAFFQTSCARKCVKRGGSAWNHNIIHLYQYFVLYVQNIQRSTITVKKNFKARNSVYTKYYYNVGGSWKAFNISLIDALRK